MSLPSSHLFVVSHGVWGVPDHMAELEKRLSEKGFETLNISGNSVWKSTSGIELCGARFYTELKAKLAEKEYEKISFIAYSFGGILARYIIGLLKTDGYLENIKPVHFITIATPHLGIRRSARRRFGRFSNWVLDYVGPIIVGQTLRELVYRDAPKLDDCLLMKLSNPEEPYLQALKLFRNRVAVANAQNDRTVFYPTASLSQSNPHKPKASMLEDFIHVLEEHPRYVVGVTPHKNASKHLALYDPFATVLVEESSRTPTTKRRSSIASKLRSWSKKVKRFLGLSIFLPFLFIVIFPFASFNRMLQARRDKKDLLDYKVVRRNGAYSLSKCRGNKVDTKQPWRQIRAWIEEHAPFTKVDVMLGGANTHSAIIARKDSMFKHEGSEVLKYVVDHCVGNFVEEEDEKSE